MMYQFWLLYEWVLILAIDDMLVPKITAHLGLWGAKHFLSLTIFIESINNISIFQYIYYENIFQY
jgi:hypothetical protein